MRPVDKLLKLASGSGVSDDLPSQINLSAAVYRHQEALRAFKQLAWFLRVPQIDLLVRLVDEELEYIDSKGLLDTLPARHVRKVQRVERPEGTPELDELAERVGDNG